MQQQNKQLHRQIRKALDEARGDSSTDPRLVQRLAAAERAGRRLGAEWRRARSRSAVEEVNRGYPSRSSREWWDSLEPHVQDILLEAAAATSCWRSRQARVKRQDGKGLVRRGIDKRLREEAGTEHRRGNRLWQRDLIAAARALDDLGERILFKGRVPSLSQIINANRRRDNEEFRQWWADLPQDCTTGLLAAKNALFFLQAARRVHGTGKLPRPGDLARSGRIRTRGPYTRRVAA